MGRDFKRTFLAGIVVLLILLLAPYYLQFINYSGANEDVSTETIPLSPEPLHEQPEDHIPYQASSSIEHKNGLTASMAEEIYIQTASYSATISSFGGGSFLQYALASKGEHQYLGGYDNKGIYSDSIDVELILNSFQACSPCVGVNKNNASLILEQPFIIRSVFLNGIESQMKNFNLSDKDSCVVTMSLDVGESTVYKKTTFIGGASFITNHELWVSPPSNINSLSLVWNSGLRNTEKNLKDEVSMYAAGYVAVNEEIEDLWFAPSSMDDQGETAVYVGTIDWAAIRNKYFIVSMIPEDVSGASLSAVPFQLNSEATVPSYVASIETNEPLLKSKLYLGPLDIDYIHSLDSSLDRIMNFGWFIIQPFSRGVLWLLKLMHSFGLNYGIVLILFAFLVRIVTGPLTKKSFQSSLKMQEVQPKLKALQEKYKNNSQKLNQEMVKLYRENSVNPLGGCFPMLLQMPLLFSLFLVFRSTIEFRGAPFFGWISNLAQPDTIFALPFNIPIYGDQVAFLPILLGISMFLTQRLSMAAMESQQKPMMYIMTAFFFLLFNSFPSGLNLYYLVYNILNYFQQKTLKRAS